MADRYLNLFRLQPNLYLEGSPVIIEAGALLKDTVTNQVLAQLKIRNLEEKKLIACKVAVRAFEPNGTELDGVPEFSYMDISIALGKDFGTKVPIYLSDSNTRRIEVSVTELVFEDDTVWKAEPCEWKELPRQVELISYFSDPEMLKQYKLETGDDCIFVPMIHHGIFQCTCGTINLASAQKCYKCQRSYEALTKAIDEEALLQKKNSRIEKEREEMKAAAIAEEEARKKEELVSHNKKRLLKKLFIIGAVVATLAVIAVWVIKPSVENAIEYHNAEQLLEEGAYDDAERAFYKLGDYRDSSLMAKKAIYQKAEHLNDSGEYKQAIEVWKSILEYSDSEERIKNAELDWKEADYQSALKKLDNGDYKAAMEGFKKLGSYKDSADLYSSTCYTYATQLAASEDYKMAIFYFEHIKGYKDADSLKTESIYNYGCKLLAQGAYKDAIDQFKKCKEYQDASNKICEAKYGYVIANKNNEDSQTYKYLKDLIKVGYSDVQAIYDELYTWKATFTVLNYDKDDTTSNYSVVDRFQTWFAHFTVTGGPLEASATFSWRITWPNGKTLSDDFSEPQYLGDYLYVYGWYDNPAYGSSGTVTVTIYAEGVEIGRTSFTIQ